MRIDHDRAVMDFLGLVEVMYVEILHAGIVAAWVVLATRPLILIRQLLRVLQRPRESSPDDLTVLKMQIAPNLFVRFSIGAAMCIGICS